MPGEKKTFGKMPVRNLMGDVGCTKVARDAVDDLCDYLRNLAVEITVEAKKLAEHAGRKMISTDDIVLATRMLEL